MNCTEHSLYRNFVILDDDDGNLASDFGQALRSNNKHSELNTADIQNIKKLRFLFNIVGCSV